ncbi:MAG: DEAD/DEAH box helicase, partial [Treponema sp.]|nr:DEAD/DEAH box helicase [Treponema sp.]
MRLSEIQTPVSSLPGVGPAMQKQFANLNIWTISDLLSYYPRSYKDRTKRISLNQFETAKEVHTIAKVNGHEWFGYGRMKTLKILIQDQSARAELICFNRPFLEKSFPVGAVIAVTGSFFIKYNALQSSSFEAELISEEGALEDYETASIPGSGILPVYKLTSGLTQKKIAKVVAAAIGQCGAAIDNDLSQDIIQKRNLMQMKDAIKIIHLPKDFKSLEDARRTLIYQELFDMQKAVLQRAIEHKGSLPAAELLDLQEQSDDSLEKKDFSPRQAALLERLPFALTKDQMAAIAQINCDIDKGYDERAKLLKAKDNEPKKAPWTMQRLLQGDVGSGKTLVALFACLRVVDWGGQCAIMAPTEILAKQHADTSARLLEAVGVRVAFLSGNVSAAQRAPLLTALKNGEINILVGTHALFSKTTCYKDLQLAVIDEQHRFGVMQRQAVVEKGRALVDQKNKNFFVSPHLLMMSAT